MGCTRNYTGMHIRTLSLRTHFAFLLALSDEDAKRGDKENELSLSLSLSLSSPLYSQAYINLCLEYSFIPFGQEERRFVSFHFHRQRPMWHSLNKMKSTSSASTTVDWANGPIIQFKHTDTQCDRCVTIYLKVKWRGGEFTLAGCELIQH